MICPKCGGIMTRHPCKALQYYAFRCAGCGHWTIGYDDMPEGPVRVRDLLKYALHTDH